MELAETLHRADLPAERRLADIAALGNQVAPLTMSRERTLPVAEALVDLFAEGGLVRGRTLVCGGSAATSLALALVAPAIAAGAWLAMVDLPAIGLDAASEFGVPLERVVAVSAGEGADRVERWPEVVAAAADGFEVLLVGVPRDVSAATLRRVTTRIRQRGAVMIAVGDPGQLSGDGVLHSEASCWSGLGDGHGYFQRREFLVRAAGRRFPDRRGCRLAFPVESAPTGSSPAGWRSPGSSPAEPLPAESSPGSPIELPVGLPA